MFMSSNSNFLPVRFFKLDDLEIVIFRGTKSQAGKPTLHSCVRNGMERFGLGLEVNNPQLHFC